jgi:ethanolamine-phosphate cytidylyltransferase
MNREYLDYVIEHYNVDYVVHGEDPCFVDGKDVYATAKQAGKFRTIPRTEGVSTTDIVGRMLLMTKEHHFGQQSGAANAVSASSTGHKSSDASSLEVHLGQQSKFLTTSRMLQLFSAGVKAPTKGMRVIYIDGAWDLFHPGHVSILKAAREVRFCGTILPGRTLAHRNGAFSMSLLLVVQRGDYLIVGVHGDAVVNKVRGMNLPLMNLHERVLSVLGCRHVDDVLIDAPYEINETMIDNLGISEVVRGRVSSDIGNHLVDPDERYRCAKERGIFTVIDSPSEFSMASIVHRIQRNQEAFQSRFERKMANETSFYREKRQSSGAACTNR